MDPAEANEIGRRKKLLAAMDALWGETRPVSPVRDERSVVLTGFAVSVAPRLRQLVRWTNAVSLLTSLLEVKRHKTRPHIHNVSVKNVFRR